MKFKYLILLAAQLGVSCQSYAIETAPVQPSSSVEVAPVQPAPVAPVQKALSLREALAAAYNNSEQLKIAQEAFLQEIEQMSRAISGFLPNVSLELSNTELKATNLSRLDPPGSAKKSQVSRSLEMQQNIFRGGSDVAALKAAQSAYRSSRAKLYEAEQKVLLDAIDDYMSFYQAKEAYNVMETALEFNSKQLKMTQEKFNLGEATRTDVAQAEAAYADAESNKLAAFSKLESAKAKFTKTFVVEPSNIALPDTPSELPESLEVLMSKAMMSNFTVLQYKHAVAAAKAGALSATGNLLPKLDFKAQVGTDYYNPEVKAGSDNEYIAATNHRTFTTSLSLTVPIFSRGGAEYSNIRTRNSEARRNAHQLDDVLANVKTASISSWTGYHAAKSAISSSDQAVKAYALVLEGVGYEYEVGSKSILDLLKVQQEFNNVRIKDIQVKKDYITSAYQMKSLTGDMTAVALKLPVKYFNPGTEFRKVKGKIIGF